jgi:SAM-dependent methyltransferase
MTTILNLGCGTRTSPATVNIDWSIYLRMHQSKIGRTLAPLWLRGHRRESFRSLNGDVVVHDLRKGIPAADGTADAVYHSHVLEHIDRQDVPAFMAEIRRVLKPGGIHRMAVPNFGRDAADYLRSLEEERPDHDDMLIPLLTESVRREAHGTSLQSPLRRRVENLVLGDARKRGQTHQWGYDRVNLRQILEANGFVGFKVVGPNESDIPGWAETGLEVDPDGTIYKPGSMWVEASKPISG